MNGLMRFVKDMDVIGTDFGLHYIYFIYLCF